MMKRLFALVFAGMLCSAAVQAQGWPTKTVHVIVPYGPGSTPDTIARLIFDRVQKNTGQSMIVENKSGAAGMIGAQYVARSAPDGSTLMLAPAGPLETNALLYKKMSYDPLKDLAPVMLVAQTPTVLVVSKDVKAGNIKQLLGEMQADQGHMSYASPGVGTLGHLDMAYLVSRAHAHIPHIAYQGSPKIITALIRGDVQMAALPPLAVMPMIKAGRIKPIAVIGPKRSFLLPDVPTLKEQGIDFGPVGWFGMATAAGVPQATLEEMHRQIALALEDPMVAKSYRAQGLETADLGPQAFSAYIQEDMKLWRPIIAQNHISLD
ncbi:ABC transporter substrate-binding protein [Candidimonas nitroreducens]|uniref:ABC transporter substrate-binding protein n=2 Tax=Candidimonas nitroreducens TaxID=683354 RepID=A0A225LYN7_9BURK|nr:ABC transporter substrate-binding protein [Candidimonas nitroreducens]